MKVLTASLEVNYIMHGQQKRLLSIQIILVRWSSVLVGEFELKILIYKQDPPRHPLIKGLTDNRVHSGFLFKENSNPRATYHTLSRSSLNQENEAREIA